MAFSARKFFARAAQKVASWCEEMKAANPAAFRETRPGRNARYIVLRRLVETPDSSWLTSFAFVRRGAENGLEITFKSGVTCFYPGTTDSQYFSLDNAPSRGKWVHNNIYNNKYVKV